jgi:hypothetical protein
VLIRAVVEEVEVEEEEVEVVVVVVDGEWEEGFSL